MDPAPGPTRRDLLTGRAVGDALADRLADAATAETRSFEAGPTVRLATRAMACEFVVALAGGKRREVTHASDALDMVHHLEQVMTVYRDDAELARVNREPAGRPVDLSEDLADVLKRAIGISALTDRAFDPTSGPLIRLWREAKQNRRVPTDDQIAAALSLTGIDGVRVVGGALEKAAEARRFDLGAIGKGFAIDRAVGHLEACAVEDFLVYGGLSSVAARGRSGENDGWPVGIGDPLRPNRRLGTLVLKNAAMATSGANNQFFRIGREKFGHIVDPRTGRPADGLLSVTVVTGSATLSDALSTAFYVMGLENSLTFCNTHMGIGTILIPNPDRGGRLTPVVHGIDPAHLDWSS